MDRKLGQRRKPDKIHAFVCTPAYDGKVDSDFANSLAEAAFCSPLYQIYMTACAIRNGAFIEMARNVYVKMFIEDEQFAECSHLFFIDADIQFEARAFVGLLRSGQPISAGVYRRRQEPEDYPVLWTPNPEIGGLWIEDGWLMCRRVPTGFLCISRPVIEEMAADAPKIRVTGQKGYVPWVFGTKFEKLDDNADTGFIGEDFSFCDNYVAKYGKQIPVWMDFDFTHAGYKGNLLKYLEKQIEAEEKKIQQSSAA